MKINITNLFVDDITKSINVRYLTTVLQLIVWDFPKYRLEKKITYLRIFCNKGLIFECFLLFCSPNSFIYNMLFYKYPGKTSE